MQNNNDWMRQLETFSNMASRWDSVIDPLKNLHQFNAESFYHLSASDTYMKYATVGGWDKQLAAYQTMREFDFSQMYQTLDFMKDFDFSAASTAIKNFSKMDDAWYNASAALRAYDAVSYDLAIQEAWKRIDWSAAAQASDILKEVTEQYIEDNELDEEASEEIREVVEKKDGRHLTEQQKKVWEVYILPFLMSLFFYILGAKQTQPATVRNITEVNHHYTVEVGMEVDTLNAYNFRMVCKDGVMARKKPDCSSKVTGHLPLGKVVCVTDKYKKWIEITWQNDEGEYCSGWVQNYKVTEFK